MDKSSLTVTFTPEDVERFGRSLMHAFLASGYTYEQALHLLDLIATASTKLGKGESANAIVLYGGGIWSGLRNLQHRLRMEECA